MRGEPRPRDHPTRYRARRAGAGNSSRGCNVRASATRGTSMNYPLLIALGLLFLAASFLVTHSTARTALVVLSCVAFLLALILTLVGTGGGHGDALLPPRLAVRAVPFGLPEFGSTRRVRLYSPSSTRTPAPSTD